jgi:hypothetical protein
LSFPGGLYDAFPTYTINFTSPRKDILQPFGEQWHLQWPRGTLVNQDGADKYTLHMPLFGVPKEMHDADPEGIFQWALGNPGDFEKTVTMVNKWNGHLVLSPTYGNGRVWMAGDSVHQVIPTGGYGMNT